MVWLKKSKQTFYETIKYAMVAIQEICHKTIKLIPLIPEISPISLKIFAIASGVNIAIFSSHMIVQVGTTSLCI